MISAGKFLQRRKILRGVTSRGIAGREEKLLFFSSFKTR